ncbi:hypothetical protein IVB44_18785 [Bradyrhizobium sp. 49]|uniref:hypothetical protein n=1 Tax=unclassified Bradyrhizobium TaxID=2631580 RepID=UPI001FFA02DF|nr:MULTISPECIES: hypothetical protein [unclassified Bradyrhizobium]MCK1270813.1 hypothetical protein [Bradyrhizobium sp. 84]MCK1373025.1 hypothetical protein [Bradyrhizobium sp. 49]
MVDSLIVFSDYSSIVLQSESDEFEKLCRPLTFYPMRCRLRQSKKSTASGAWRRMVRASRTMKTQIAETEASIVAFAEQAKSGETFAERVKDGLVAHRPKSVDQ